MTLFLDGIKGGCRLAGLFVEGWREGTVEPGVDDMAMDRRAGGTLGGGAEFRATDSLRVFSPSAPLGEAGVLNVLGFLGTGGAGLRCVEDTEDIERGRLEGE
jgi:hypothetical protein